MATAYIDAVNGQPLTITINAVAWAQPVAAGWLTRCRELNRLLHKATHLLRTSVADKAEPIWYAGVAGTSLAAGIERMATTEAVLRNAIVAFPLDTRVYVADVQKGLVRGEWILYSDAFEERVQAWRNDGRDFALLTGGGRLDINLPNAAQIPIDIDTGAMTFQHATIALLSTGLLRWRDCVSVVSVLVVALGISAALAWWHRTPTIDPLKHVAALVAQPAAPIRYEASAELAKLAMLVAQHDAVLWDAEGATELNYEAARGSLELHFANASPISTPIEPLPNAPPVDALQPFTLTSFQTKLAEHLDSPMWTVTFGDPYPVGLDAELEQHFTITINKSANAQEISVAGALVDLSERVVRLPIMLHEANCTVTEGVVDTCDLKFAIRGLSA